MSLQLRQLATLARAKVRLGSLGHNGQKEVDILLHDDLTALARGGLVASIFLLSGDGDFRPTVARAQESGVEVTVLGIPSQPAASSLVREADSYLVLSPELLRPFFRRRRPPRRSDVGLDSITAADLDDYERTVMQAGADFAAVWSGRAAAADIKTLRNQGHWTLPRQLDAELMKYVDRTTELLANRPDLKQSARAGFWSALARQA
jgi:hypothetical protein